ncbi:NosD domain-containing protein [Dokdonella sp.]|uniref:NosD domain-containing protein n=1 Tax=Dokdonella sp. TaxID=2291710 RepID=UPI003783D1AA
MSIRLRTLPWLALLLIACLHKPAFATEERCVDTSGELLGAILLAVDDDVVIHVVQGTYHLDVNPLDLIDDPSFGYTITIVGGYNSACTSRSLDPHLTTITGDADIVQLQTYDSLDIDSIRFAHIAGGVWLEAVSYGGSGPDEQVTLRRVIFEDLCTSGSCNGVNNGGYAVGINSDAVSMSHVLAVHNAHSGCALYVDNHDLDDVFLSYSVVGDNAGDGLCITDTQFADDDYRLHAENNIFWDNAGGQDIRTRASGHLTLRNNIYQVLDASPAPIGAPTGTLNQDPDFTAPASNDYHLQVGSPAVNSGTPFVSNPLTQDIDGGPRTVGSAPDRGVYETNIDDTNTLVVTTTADQLVPQITGSLRWAITQANADGGLNYIHFNIPGGCPRIITLAAPLPTITDRVIIDGYTQPGSAENTAAYGFNADICIGIRGDLSDDYAFRIPSSVSASHYLQLSGVAIGGFDNAAVDLQGGAGSWIHGVQFAGTLGSTALGNNAVNIRVSGSSTYYNLIGGEETADRNIIPYAWVTGVLMLATHANGSTVQNNYIGTSANGLAAAPNQVGIQVTGSHHTIRDNLISGNQSYGIELAGTSALDNFIASNRVGVRSITLCLPTCGPSDLPNIADGIRIHGDAHDNSINSNTIAWNGGAGVRIVDGLHNSLLSNTIYENDGLGIDLNAAGVDPVDNDAAPGAANLANRGLNYPALSLAEGGKHRGHVVTAFVSTNGTYLVQLFSDGSCDASGHGEGRKYHSTSVATIDNASPGSNGSVIVDIPVSSTSALGGRQFSMVVRDLAGNSSEFSNCAAYTCDQIFGYGGDGSSADTCP